MPWPSRPIKRDAQSSETYSIDECSTLPPAGPIFIDDTTYSIETDSADWGTRHQLRMSHKNIKAAYANDTVEKSRPDEVENADEPTTAFIQQHEMYYPTVDNSSVDCSYRHDLQYRQQQFRQTHVQTNPGNDIYSSGGKYTLDEMTIQLLTRKRNGGQLQSDQKQITHMDLDNGKCSPLSSRKSIDKTSVQTFLPKAEKISERAVQRAQAKRTLLSNRSNARGVTNTLDTKRAVSVPDNKRLSRITAELDLGRDSEMDESPIMSPWEHDGFPISEFGLLGDDKEEEEDDDDVVDGNDDGDEDESLDGLDEDEDGDDDRGRRTQGKGKGILEKCQLPLPTTTTVAGCIADDEDNDNDVSMVKVKAVKKANSTTKAIQSSPYQRSTKRVKNVKGEVTYKPNIFTSINRSLCPRAVSDGKTGKVAKVGQISDWVNNRHLLTANHNLWQPGCVAVTSKPSTKASSSGASMRPTRRTSVTNTTTHITANPNTKTTTNTITNTSTINAIGAVRGAGRSIVNKATLLPSSFDPTKIPRSARNQGNDQCQVRSQSQSTFTPTNGSWSWRRGGSGGGSAWALANSSAMCGHSGGKGVSQGAAMPSALIHRIADKQSSKTPKSKTVANSTTTVATTITANVKSPARATSTTIANVKIPARVINTTIANEKIIARAITTTNVASKASASTFANTATTFATTTATSTKANYRAPGSKTKQSSQKLQHQSCESNQSNKRYKQTDKLNNNCHKPQQQHHQQQGQQQYQQRREQQQQQQHQRQERHCSPMPFANVHGNVTVCRSDANWTTKGAPHKKRPRDSSANSCIGKENDISNIDDVCKDGINPKVFAIGIKDKITAKVDSNVKHLPYRVKLNCNKGPSIAIQT